jgi:hypothetical protein
VRKGVPAPGAVRAPPHAGALARPHPPPPAPRPRSASIELITARVEHALLGDASADLVTFFHGT